MSDLAGFPTSLWWFERLAADRRAELLARLCLNLVICLRETLARAEPDVAAARAYGDMLHGALSVLPSLSVGPPHPLHDEASERLGVLIASAARSIVAAQFRSALDEAMAYVRSSALGPGANSNETLAGLTDRAKAQIAFVASAHMPGATHPVPIICWNDGPMIGGFYDDAVGIEEDITTIGGQDITLWLDSDEDVQRFRGRTLDFDGERFVLI